ncbi:hypothetical protein ACFQ2H_01285 [Streptomyces violaceoruber]
MSEQGVAGPYGQVGCHVANGWTVVRAADEIDIAFAPLVRAEVGGVSPRVTGTSYWTCATRPSSTPWASA